MKPLHKTLLALAALLGLLLAAAGTMAWLTAQAQTVNRLTAGQIGVSLSEVSWQDESQLTPGTTVTKDPTLTVAQGSADCYVFATVRQSVPYAFDLARITIEHRNADDTWSKGYQPGWQLIDVYEEEGGELTAVYSWQNAPVTAAQTAAAPLSLPLFGRLDIPATTTVEMANTAAQCVISIQAWAMQAEGFSTARDAWDALNVPPQSAIHLPEEEWVKTQPF